MSDETLQINCSVRNVLARFWTDQTRLTHHVRRGHVHFGGEFHVLGPPEARGDAAVTLKNLESAIRGLRDVKSVRFELLNWVRDEAGNWSPVVKEFQAPPTQAASQGQPSSSVVDL